VLNLNDTVIKGSNMKVHASMPLPADDLSGQSSITETGETGNKAKQLTITMSIGFKQSEELTKLINLAEATDSNGARVVYNILGKTAEAWRIRQVVFKGEISSREDENTQQWLVTFKLHEKRSVPEKIESRASTQPVTDQVATGTDATTGVEVADTVAELSDFESVVLKADQWLGKQFSDEA
jgi:hypothetical protein